MTTMRSAWRFLACLQVIFGFATLGNATVHIIGATGGVNEETGERPLRRDLTELQDSGAAFDLYIQALKQFQESSRDELTSFFEIAGVHGYPFKAWDGVEGTRNAGYCSHGSTLFPSWHRPFMALMEQVIYDYAQDIAASYPESQLEEYVAAAETLRLPYWDWAYNPEMPESMITPEITINTPEGSQNIWNPLYSFQLSPTADAGFPMDDGMGSYDWTVRSPDDQGYTQIEVSQDFLRQSGSSLRINTYQLLSSETNYTVMSTDSLEDRGSNYNSLEALHNIVHGSIGGYGGHMTPVPWSAYEPAFWLHHANVDRLFAMWQAINPDSYVIPVPNRSGDFVKEPGTEEDGDTPLTPFRYDDENYYTTNSAWYLSSFGYSYPEIEDWNYNQEDLAAEVRQKANELYNQQDASSAKHKHKHRRAHGHHGHSVQQSQDKRDDGGLLDTLGLDDILDNVDTLLKSIGNIATTTLEKFGELEINNLAKQWVVNVKVPGDAQPNPFSILFFLGSPPKDASSYATAPNLVGSYTCNMQKPYTTYTQIPLSHALAAIRSNGLLESLESDIVLPILSKHLQWRAVSLADGSAIDSATSSLLEVQIASREVEPLTQAGSNVFPSFGEWTVHDDVQLACMR